MQIDVSRALKDPGQSYPFEATAEIEPMTVLEDPVRFTAVRLNGQMVGAGEAVRVYAAVEADVESRCALCLEPVTKHLKADIDALKTNYDKAVTAFEQGDRDTAAEAEGLLRDWKSHRTPIAFSAPAPIPGEDPAGVCTAPSSSSPAPSASPSGAEPGTPTPSASPSGAEPGTPTASPSGPRPTPSH